MNLLGKILIVTLFVLSIIFMSLSVVVFATHRNWKTIADARQEQLTAKQTEFDNKVRELQDLESRLTAETEAAVNQVAKLEQESARLTDEITRILRRNDELSLKDREKAAALAATQQANNQLADEVTRLRESISENIKKKDDAFAVALQATEEVQSIRNDLESATERGRDLVMQTSQMESLLRSKGIDPNTPADGVTPRVDGFVSKVQRRNGSLYVEISIGSDDGLHKNDTVEVFNGSKYLGRLEILQTAPDRSVGRVDTRYQQGPIQEGDRVATRLNLG